MNKEYIKKPTAYLDQNILDMFVESRFSNFKNELKDKFQIIYSNETLKEIKRSGTFFEKFLSILKDLDAYHIQIFLEQPNFIVTNQATISIIDPFEAYNNYCEGESEYPDMSSAMEQWLLKFSGGRIGDGISEIHDEQKIAFNEHMNQLITNVREISDNNPDIMNEVEQLNDLLQYQLNSSLDSTEKILKENIDDDKNWSGIKDHRNATGIAAIELNNIKPPNVLRQIWAKLKSSPPYRNLDIDIESFFGLDSNPIYPDQPHFNHQRITGIYNMLNTIGYYPDKQIQRERKFVASLSDTNHASIASFCNFLFSRDEKFVHKVKAAYEYLGIPTVVKHVSIKKA